VARRRAPWIVVGVLAVAGAAAVAPDAGTALVVSAPLDRPDAILVLASHEIAHNPPLVPGVFAQSVPPGVVVSDSPCAD